MATIKFSTDRMGLSGTKCPYGMKNDSDVIFVGSHDCFKCKYHLETSKQRIAVDCSYDHDKYNNIKNKN